MQTKTIGVVIPIYNVEKYLKECLDSVINQTYTNLEIILVNDGSTDENSLNIAKEYTLKDKRITLFDKKNGGQSTARNVGIEYFSGEYKLKNKTQTIKENSLIEFNIEGNNPYEIYTVYKSYKAFNNEQDLTSFTYPIIDYIIFLDSDDYWELNCIEECVPRMDGVDVLWFDYRPLYDKVKRKHISQMTYFDYKNEIIITPKEWLEKARERRLFYFWFTWQGMINFDFFKNIKLKFINGIFAEDCHFGVLLFALSKNIYVLSKQIYIYRLRELSSMNFTNKKWIIHPNSHLKKIDVFENSSITRLYYESASWMQIALDFIKFIDSNHYLSEGIKTHFLPVVCNKALTLQRFDKDPLCLKKHTKNLKIYIQNQPLGAVDRVKKYLSYKLTKELSRKKGILRLTLPFSVIRVSLQHQKGFIEYKKNIKRDVLNKRLPLEFYRDYQQALTLKNQKLIQSLHDIGLKIMSLKG
ncbi:glycosyltransferase family 2 protein [Campylobacter coli]|uniref:Glycosyltransferase n=2 Tax=Campylobacter coli TaxID=195 RepID=A0A5T1BYD5_CAMCO|nr:glycosyltransferase family 2 protein [Campylobacter coli]ALL29746.1 glycosyl transferase family 2 [Campylobacter coli]ALL31240.1 glycosyl transferase family 2 [Campylobacter coli]ALL33108.1 glycosyl transferase family 2 [Campylobacter coli]EAH4662938.1 glycosyltransferase family 2 protein [Campylobacter coli]EAH4664666.1 glycosyltransferase family 2 protein [Campylobacter coli]